MEIKEFRVGESRLEGVVQLSGAKNAILTELPAALLTSEPVSFENYPTGLLDVKKQEAMLELTGKKMKYSDNRLLITEPESLNPGYEWDDRSIRSTLQILAALLSRFSEGSVPLPGGCPLGERKYDLHVMAMEKFGARVWEENGYLKAEAARGLHGTDIHFPIRSTGATETAILCATLAKGQTRIWNPHIRPEIIDLVDLLKKMGADITVMGQQSVVVNGVSQLNGTHHRIISDNMEALTWLIGATITSGNVEILDFPFRDLEVPLIFLRESGAAFYQKGTSMVVTGGQCYPIEISTGPYPGINSDMQPLFAVFGAVATGESHIVDLRFPGRYAYAAELEKLGMKYSVDDNLLRIHGGGKLSGNQVKAVDLRAGIALVLAGLVSSGETLITDGWQVLRGYDDFVNKMLSLGANLKIGRE